MVQIQQSMKAADPKAALESAVKKSLSNIKRKIIVMSGKGGVGKSSTAVNLAIALALKGARVGLLDVDLHGPDIPRMLGLSGVLDINEQQLLIPKKYNENLAAISVDSLTGGPGRCPDMARSGKILGYSAVYWSGRLGQP